MECPRMCRTKLISTLLVLVYLGAPTQAVADTTADEIEFFERHIRPVLVENCYECHGGNLDDLKGGLNLTFRDGTLNGGDSGTAVLPGAPEKSPLFEAIQYHNTDLQMPPAGKLSDDVIARFERWIKNGAADPRASAPSAQDLEKSMSWEAIRDRRMSWWSFQPVQATPPPAVVPEAWSENPIDAFIKSHLDAADVEASPAADPHALVRRLYFVLTGLPPTPSQVDEFVAAAAVDRRKAVADIADRLLASAAFGERWGRHWMDWMRYAETHGSEGDPAIPHAWRYRDYIIRALNEDIPYDDLVREHLAGDKIASPRINTETGVNESMLGTAQYRFVLHGFAPTDALDERVRYTDNQIDVVSKAFLGMTVSCARCHDHKFDPISQKDYYALFGIMATGHPATVTVDAPERQNINKEKIADTKIQLRSVMAEQWLEALGGISDTMKQAKGPWEKALANATTNKDPLHAWQRLRHAEKSAFERGWRELAAQWSGSNRNRKARQETPYPLRWKLGNEDAGDWVSHGNGPDARPTPAGSFDVRESGDPIIRAIYPAGIFSHLYSTKHSGVLASPRFDIEDKLVYVRMAGDGDAFNRYVVQDYPRNGTVYPVKHLKGGDWRWQRWDLGYWQGDNVHIELSTANDQAVLSGTNPKRSWFGVTEVVVVGKGQPTPQDEMADFVIPLFEQEGSPKNADELIGRYQTALRNCVVAWRDGTMTDGQAHFLDAFVRPGLLPNTLAQVPDAKGHVEEYRRLDAEIPYPTRAPGILEGAPIDQPLYTRGNHKQPEAPVKRRFLEAIDATPFDVPDAGRLALAESIVASNNPLAARVIVNRLWHHTFGRGIVATPDNLGVMGELPTHPELLDFLSTRMREENWSMKSVIRLLVTSQTFQLDAVPSTTAQEKDPGNTLWSHSMLRRLEGEAIRDAMLAASGRLDRKQSGKPVGGHDNRRSVYVRVIRNSLDPFLTTFDAPTPVSTKGRRDSTNVPAHALTLMNDPFVRSNATALAKRIAEDQSLTESDARIARMVQLTLARAPSDREMEQLLAYLDAATQRAPGREQDEVLDAEMLRIESRLAAIETQLTAKLKPALEKEPNLAKESLDKQQGKVAPELVKERAALKKQLAPLQRLGAAPEPWVEIAQSLFSLKEFTYLR
jgi:hypothetical protein